MLINTIHDEILVDRLIDRKLVINIQAYWLAELKRIFVSYSISIGDYHSSVTWNVMPMFVLAFTGRQWRRRVDRDMRAREREEINQITQFKELCGLVAGEVLPFLEASLRHMSDEGNKEEYQSLNAKNGWGTHKRTLEIFTKMVEACREFPEERISIR